MSIIIANIPRPPAGSICHNNVTEDHLRFQSSNRNSIVRVMLPMESLLFLQCCVQMASPSVSWFANSRPIEYYGDIFTLADQGQVLYSNVFPPQGYYDCVASNGSATITTTFIINPLRVLPCCQYGHVGQITKDKPRADVYDVKPHQTLQLECVATVHCGFSYLVNFLQWHKVDLRTNTYAYSLGQEDPYDNATGDSVNVFYKYNSTCNDLTIYANLTIAKVSPNDLVYQNELVSTDCDPSKRACNTSATSGYACTLILPGSNNPAQKNATIRTFVRLHAASTTAPGLESLTSPGSVGYTKQKVIATNFAIVLGGANLARSLKFNEYMFMIYAFTFIVVASFMSKDKL